MKSAEVLVSKQNFIKSSLGDITKHYTFDKEKIVGSGGYGSVVCGVKINSGEKRAIKIIKKTSVSQTSDFANEIEIMKGLVKYSFSKNPLKSHKPLKTLKTP